VKRYPCTRCLLSRVYVSVQASLVLSSSVCSGGVMKSIIKFFHSSKPHFWLHMKPFLTPMWSHTAHSGKWSFINQCLMLPGHAWMTLSSFAIYLPVVIWKRTFLLILFIYILLVSICEYICENKLNIDQSSLLNWIFIALINSASKPLISLLYSIGYLLHWSTVTLEEYVEYVSISWWHLAEPEWPFSGHSW